MTSPDRDASRSEWLAVFDRAYRRVDAVGEIPCPGCGRSALRLAFVVDSLDSPDATAAFWCGECLQGLMPNRVHVPHGASPTLRGTERVPDYHLVEDDH